MAETPKSNNWFVITGAPSTGKTTLINGLSMLGYATVPEAARLVIDEAIKQGRTVEELRKIEKDFQHQVLNKKLELEKKQPAEKLTFFDRGLHDTLAYLHVHQINIEDYVHELISARKYKRVFLLEPLEFFDKDYARTENRSQVLQLQKLLSSAYADHGMPPLSVPFLPPRQRLQFVLDNI